MVTKYVFRFCCLLIFLLLFAFLVNLYVEMIFLNDKKRNIDFISHEIAKEFFYSYKHFDNYFNQFNLSYLFTEKLIKYFPYFSFFTFYDLDSGDDFVLIFDKENNLFNLKSKVDREFYDNSFYIVYNYENEFMKLSFGFSKDILHSVNFRAFIFIFILFIFIFGVIMFLFICRKCRISFDRDRYIQNKRFAELLGLDDSLDILSFDVNMISLLDKKKENFLDFFDKVLFRLKQIYSFFFKK